MKPLSLLTILLLISSITSFGQTVTGTGTLNYVPKFTGTSIIGNSLIYDNGTNVGIGVTNPQSTLQIGTLPGVSTSTPYSISLGGTYSPVGGANMKIKVFDDGSSIAGFGISGGQLNYGVWASSADHVFYQSTTELMRIKGTGNVGIGFTSPTYKLDVNGTARFTGDAFVNGITLGLGGGAAASNTMFGFGSGAVNTTGTVNSFFGYHTGTVNTSGTGNSFFGFQSGTANTSGNNNNFFGFNTGAFNTTGVSNSFYGAAAGFSNTIGNYNSFFGQSAGYNNTTGVNNNFLGFNAGINNTSGNDNTFLGLYAGISNTTASNNVYIGNQAGNFNTIGNNNTFLGYNAGYFIADGVTNAAMMDNSILLGFKTKVQANNQTNQIVIGYGASGLGSNTTVLGNTSTIKTAIYGNILIGKTTQTNASYILDVNGNVRANKITVNTTGADFVFEPGYKLPSLKDLELFVKSNHHLPGIAPAKEMQDEGMELGENQTKLLQKVEELTLYMIELNKKVEALTKENEILRQQNK